MEKRAKELPIVKRMMCNIKGKGGRARDIRSGIWRGFALWGYYWGGVLYFEEERGGLRGGEEGGDIQGFCFHGFCLRAQGDILLFVVFVSSKFTS